MKRGRRDRRPRSLASLHNDWGAVIHDHPAIRRRWSTDTNGNICHSPPHARQLTRIPFETDAFCAALSHTSVVNNSRSKVSVLSPSPFSMQIASDARAWGLTVSDIRVPSCIVNQRPVDYRTYITLCQVPAFLNQRATEVC